MNDRPNVKRADHPEELRSIPKWARVYGQNRSLPVLVFFVGETLLCLGLVALVVVATMAYRGGNMALFWPSAAIFVVAIVAIECFAAYVFISPRGSNRVNRLLERLYAKEGFVSVSEPEISDRRWREILGVMLLFAVCYGVLILLYQMGLFPTQYIQPVVALSVVLCFVVLWILTRPMIGHVTLLFPALYGLHAILAVAGVPVGFTGQWAIVLNLAVPAFGYGILVGLISHAYSRYALYRLKKLTQVDCATGSQPNEKAE
ncbi:MAG: hypothetical protein QGG71_14395 [Pirellulaceae bacterium]|nr:hypothetical protein [Pirellulaceae bacterium]